MRFFVTSAILVFFSWSNMARGNAQCPAFLSQRDLPLRFDKVPRNQWALFSLTKAKGLTSQWQAIDLQIDPIDGRGKMEFFSTASQWQTKNLGYNDRLAFHIEEFGERYHSKMKRPCGSKRMVELSSGTNPRRYAYLAICEKPVLRELGRKKWPVLHDGAAHSLVSDDYTYQYLPTNHLMFESITVKDSGQSEGVVPARGSELSIRGDVKNFFTMNFDHSDVESNLKNIRKGPLGVVGILTFYLRVLFFRVNLNLFTEISFFKNSVYVPMLLNLPVDPQERLHPSSGFLFTWENPGGETRYQSGEGAFPVLDAKLVKTGASSLLQNAEPYCEGSRCLFTLRGQKKHIHWALRFAIHKERVKQGFFPQFVSDSFQAKKSLGWKKVNDHDRGRVGIYFEVSGLPKGRHPYDFWILLARNQEANIRCPAPISVVRMVP